MLADWQILSIGKGWQSKIPDVKRIFLTFQVEYGKLLVLDGEKE